MNLKKHSYPVYHKGRCIGRVIAESPEAAAFKASKVAKNSRHVNPHHIYIEG